MTLCVGDLVGDWNGEGISAGSQAFSILDQAGISYLVTDGNHDNAAYKKYFGGNRYENMEGYRGTGPFGVSSYMIRSAGSYEYLFLSLPWEPEDLGSG